MSDILVHLVDEDTNPICEEPDFDLGVGVNIWDYIPSEERCPRCDVLYNEPDVKSSLLESVKRRLEEGGEFFAGYTTVIQLENEDDA